MRFTIGYTYIAGSALGLLSMPAWAASCFTEKPSAAFLDRCLRLQLSYALGSTSEKARRDVLGSTSSMLLHESNKFIRFLFLIAAAMLLQAYYIRAQLKPITYIQLMLPDCHSRREKLRRHALISSIRASIDILFLIFLSLIYFIDDIVSRCSTYFSHQLASRVFAASLSFIRGFLTLSLAQSTSPP